MNINAGAFAVIFNEKEEVLLVHRTDFDVWECPGGKMESGETPWQAAVREVKEETGYDVEIVRLISVASRRDKDDLIFTFLARIIGGNAVINREADAIKFFPMDQLPRNIVPSKIERINDGLKALHALPECILKDLTGKIASKEYFEKYLK